MLVVGRANSHVASAFSTRLKLIFSNIQPENHQNIQKPHFWPKAPGVNGLQHQCNHFSHRGQTTPLMFHEGYICFFYTFVNQVWQMSFDCCPVHFNLEVVTQCQIMTSKNMFFFKIFFNSHSESYVNGKALT